MKIILGTASQQRREVFEEIRTYLRSLHEAPSRMVNGIVVTNTATGKQIARSDTSVATFRQIPDEDVERIIKTGKVFAWAGGFATEDPLFAPYVESMEGADGSARGLPKALVARLINEAQEESTSHEKDQ